MGGDPKVTAVDVLRDHQHQLDADGVMVGVSRQAIDEVLAERETLLTAVREMRSVLKQLNYWFDADEEFLAAMSSDELADHNRQVAKISTVLTKYAGIGE